MGLAELNALEEIFLEIIDWDLNVSESQYSQYHLAFQKFFTEPLQPQTIQVIEELNKHVQALEEQYGHHQ